MEAVSNLIPRRLWSPAVDPPGTEARFVTDACRTGWWGSAGRDLGGRGVRRTSGGCP